MGQDAQDVPTWTNDGNPIRTIFQPSIDQHQYSIWPPTQNSRKAMFPIAGSPSNTLKYLENIDWRFSESWGFSVG
jgi:hypothetical protein